MSLNTCWKNEARLAKVLVGGCDRVHPTRFSFLPFPFLCLACLHAQSLNLSDSLQSYGLQPARLFCPWDFSGKNTGTCCHALLQGIFPTQGSNPRLLHCRRILYSLSYPGSPSYVLIPNKHPTLQILPQSWLLNNPAYSKYLLIPNYSNVSFTLTVLKVNFYSYYKIIAKMNSEFPQQLF